MASGHASLRRPSRPEAALVRAAALAVGLTAAVALPVSGILAGTAGLAGAATAVAMLALFLGLSAAIHALAAPLPWNAFLLLTLGGLALRLVAYLVVVLALGGVEALHGTSLAATAVGGIILGQILEMRALTKNPGRAAPVPGAAGMEGADR